MANRLLLTLLALLTGLAAQIASAEARACPQQAQVAVCAPVAARAPAAPVELARLPEPGRRHARLVADEGGGLAALAWRAPSVRMGIDRARE